jgi:hypothetical protein
VAEPLVIFYNLGVAFLVKREKKIAGIDSGERLLYTISILSAENGRIWK